MTELDAVIARALRVPISSLAAGALQPVRVAVLDSGIDASHTDLRNRVESAVICSADEKGSVAITPSDPTANNDTYGHGTAVASIIARIAPNATLIDVRVLGGNKPGSPDAFLGGIDFANSTDAQIMNMSVAVGESYLPRLIPLTEKAYRRGKIIVAATRNRPLEDEGYPASIVACIGVGNAGRGREDIWRFRRDIIEFMGHGVDVPVAVAGGGYATQSGTSFATPIIAGLIALLLGAHSGLSPFDVKAILKAFAANAASS
ncbi:S8 family serine peptidase [Mesorhizobium sp. M0663]|uniref:S8 family serine peptidase n=1 Tax=unclassified Mesorhizobium TaxID=325217 RepID=UPI003334D9BD